MIWVVLPLKKRLKLPATSTDVHGMQCSALRISFLKISSSHSTDLLPEQVPFLLFNLLEFIFLLKKKKSHSLRKKRLNQVLVSPGNNPCFSSVINALKHCWKLELCNYCLNKVRREKAGWISWAQFLQEYVLLMLRWEDETVPRNCYQD